MATQRCNLSVARIDLNALDLQRREAVVMWFSGSIYNKKMNPANTCGKQEGILYAHASTWAVEVPQRHFL